MSDTTASPAKESRTDKLLRVLQVPDDFKDPTLPSGVFSHSQYNSWLICGKAYEFKYVKKIPTPEFVATSTGSAVHAGAELALVNKMAGRIIPIEEGLDLVGNIIEEKSKQIVDWTVGQGDDADKMDVTKLKNKAQRLFRAFYTQALPRLRPLAIEKGFAKVLGNVPVIGFVDLVDLVPALEVPGMTPEEQANAPMKRVTVDLKTSRAKWSKAQIATNSQLTTYSLVEGTPDIRVDQLVDLKSGPVYHRGEGIRDAIDHELLVDHINEVADFVRKGVFPMTDFGNWACNRDHCSFWHLCRGKKR